MEPTTEKKTNGSARSKATDRAPRNFREPMPCKLSADELVERGAKLAEAFEEKERLDSERKNVNDGFKAKIELVEGHIREISSVLRSKTESREVEMIEEFVYRTHSVRVKRADTEEVVRERAMTRDERQEKLPLENGKKEAPKAEAAPAADGAEITDPQKVLDSDPKTAAPKAKRGRKSKA